MWNENEHPRGQPDNKGQFTKKHDGAGGTHEATEAEDKRLRELGIGTASLSKQEWALLYQRFGEIKRGAHVDNLPNGDMVIPIEPPERGVLVIASGEYGNETAKSIYSFKNKDYMYDLIERLNNGY